MKTIRQQMIDLLEEEEMGVRDLSQALKIKEKEVLEHLPHIERSLKSMKKKIAIIPSNCFSCGFVFQDRKRFSRPSRCPRCRDTHIESPMFHII
ncbi:MAG: transcriptional regulator [Deltaproteobacteria bacterium]|nr:transcriptional regulator [Deltaproteobacteria bacterium]MBW1847381.1 transcriptional regulator [Deltaproteobacteria bacterium]MBW2179220.1 transcriptional regulator [Deltaproteobacteria bacterium]MBW2364371.1 transcriptional regulator [Deltaproteobacteria bacterium]